MKDPERLDLPSASSFGIVAACPGQPNLKLTLPDNIVEIVDEITTSGTKIHAARESGNTADLTVEELAVYENGIRYEQRVYDDWVSAHNFDRIEEGPRESRLWLYDTVSANPIISAQLDVHYIGFEKGKRHLLVNDWKTGWAWNLTPSQRNWQLRVQAVCAWGEYNDIEGVRVALIKARISKERFDFTDYFPVTLSESERSIRQILWLSQQPDAPRIAGNHCAFCPCKSFCREAAALALLPTVANIKYPVANELDIQDVVEQMSLQDLAAVHRKASVIGKILEAIKVRLRTFDAASLEKVGLARREGSRNSLINPEKVFQFLKEYGISEKEIWTAAKFSIGELVDALRRDQGWGTAQTEGFIKGQLEDCIETKQSEDSIVSL